MIQNRKYLYTDVNGMEVRDDVAPLFDLVANDGDVHEYIADVVPSHWHSELEIFWLLEGRVRVGIGEEVHEIKAGYGCFINTGVIHSVAALVDGPCRYRSFVFDAGILAGMPGSVFDVKYIRPLMENGPAYVFWIIKAKMRRVFARSSARLMRAPGKKRALSSACGKR